jgi:hypothetical protein
MGLIAVKDQLKFRAKYAGWAGKWLSSYRFYNEIGKEVDRRLTENDGLSVIMIASAIPIDTRIGRWSSKVSEVETIH